MPNIEEYKYVPAIAFDTETHRFAEGYLIPKLVCISLALKEGNDYFANVAVAAEPTALTDYIETVVHAERAVAHNTPFDLAVLAGERPDLLPEIFNGLAEGRFEDTIIREKLLHLGSHGDLSFARMPNGTQFPIKYSLGALSKRYLGTDRDAEKNDSDSWRTNFKELEHLKLSEWPVDAMKYVCQDADDCLRIREIQEEARVQVWRACGHDPFETQAFQVAVAFSLYLMSAWGFLVDEKAKAAIEAELAEELKPERMARLVAAGILRPGTPPRPHKTNPGKMTAGTKESIDKKALTAYVEAWARGAGIELKKTAPTDRCPEGQTSTDIEFFEDHKHEDPIFEEYHHRQKLQKLVTTEMPRMSGKIVHPCFNVLVTTGRTSSYASELYPSFNCQNVHPKVRGCFIPRPGNLMFSIDYSGMELGTLAQKVFNLFGHSVHRDKINAGIDNHTFLGAQLAYALDPSFQRACNEAGAASPDEIYTAFCKCKEHSDPAVKKFFAHYRKFSKPTGLGYPGGLGPKTFIAYAKATYGIQVDLDMAMKLRDIWHSTYPEMKPYFRWINECCVDPINSDATETKYAYTTPFGMYIAGQGYCNAANGAALQAFSAEGAKLSVFSVIRACYDRTQCSILYGKMRPTAFIHDEILGEVPEENAHELVYEAARLMVESMAVVTPDVTPKAQPVLMRRWNKLAEPVFDKEGRLKPWESTPKS